MPVPLTSPPSFSCALKGTQSRHVEASQLPDLGASLLGKDLYEQVHSRAEKTVASCLPVGQPIPLCCHVFIQEPGPGSARFVNALGEGCLGVLFHSLPDADPNACTGVIAATRVHSPTAPGGGDIHALIGVHGI